jgi:hypothetical protein
MMNEIELTTLRVCLAKVRVLRMLAEGAGVRYDATQLAEVEKLLEGIVPL